MINKQHNNNSHCDMSATCSNWENGKCTAKECHLGLMNIPATTKKRYQLYDSVLDRVISTHDTRELAIDRFDFMVNLCVARGVGLSIIEIDAE